MVECIIDKDVIDVINNVIVNACTSFTTISIKLINPIYFKKLCIHTTLSFDLINIINSYLHDVIDLKLKYNFIGVWSIGDGFGTSFSIDIIAKNIMIDFINYSFRFNIYIYFQNNTSGAQYINELHCYHIDSDTLIYETASYDNKRRFAKDDNKKMIAFCNELDENSFNKYTHRYKDKHVRSLNFDIFFNSYLKQFDDDRLICYRTENNRIYPFDACIVEKCDYDTQNKCYKYVKINQRVSRLTKYCVMDDEKMLNVIKIIRSITQIINTCNMRDLEEYVKKYA